MSIERRVFHRYYLSGKENVLLLIKQSDQFIKARLLNISQGGIAFAISRKHSDLFNPAETGTDLQITSVMNSDFSFLLDKKIKLRWVIRSHALDHIGAGCEFIAMDANAIDQINRLFTHKEIIETEF